MVGNPSNVQFASHLSPHVKVVLRFRRFEPGNTDSSVIRASSGEGVGDYKCRSRPKMGGQEYKQCRERTRRGHGQELGADLGSGSEDAVSSRVLEIWNRSWDHW